jgi:poly-gamma-glutamate capsule biosynthesis protein CapA/YwtB (metallophosphatase superfamily)
MWRTSSPWPRLLSLSLVVIGVLALVVQIFQPQKLSVDTLFESQSDPPPTAGILFKPQSPTLDSIFTNDHSWTATLSAQKTTRVLVTGDVLLAREVNVRMKAQQNVNWPWEQTVEVLRGADITVINLETPLLTPCQMDRSRMIFCGLPENVQGMKWAGVDVASLANNHMLNHGVEGVEQTKQILDDAGILITGTSHEPTIVERNGIKFGFLGYTDIGVTAGQINEADLHQLSQDIIQAKQQADVVIPFFHWGEEYQSLPTARQQELAHTAIEAGADMVVGNHPHWYQSVEVYNGKVIAYSHGNFIFDQMWSMETRLGVVGLYTFYEDQLVDVEYLPVQIEDYGQPRWLKGEEKAKILKQLHEISKDLQTSI